MTMTTLMLLLAQYHGREKISLRELAENHFGLPPEALERKIKAGKIAFELPTTKIENYRRTGVALTCLANYIQDRRTSATARMKEYSPELLPSEDQTPTND